MKKILLTLAALLLVIPASAQMVGPINISSTQCAQISTFNQMATVGIYVTGTFTGTLQPEGTIQGQAAFNMQVAPSTSTTLANTITASGAYVARVAGLSTFLLCGATVNSGTAVIYMNGSVGQIGGGAGGSGGSGVSSVGLSVNSGSTSGIFAVTGSPVTSSGTLNINLSGTLGETPYFNTTTTLFGTGNLLQQQNASSTTLLGAIPTQVDLEDAPTQTASGNNVGLYVFRNFSPASASSASFFNSAFDCDTPSGNTSNFTGATICLRSTNRFRGSGTEAATRDAAFETQCSTTGAVTDCIGVRIRARQLANGPMSNQFPLQIDAWGYVGDPGNGTNPITNAAAISISSPTVTANSGITTATALNIAKINATGVTNAFAIRTDSTDTSQLGVVQAVGSLAVGSTGQTNINSSGVLTAYNGITAAGLGFPVQVARVRAVSQVAAITTTTLLTTGAANTDYLVVATLYCDTTSAAATATLTISYTDPGSQAQTIAPSAAACTALGATSFALVNSPIVAKTGTNITYAVAIANTPTYDIRIDLYQLGTN